MKYIISFFIVAFCFKIANSHPQPAHYNNWIFGENCGITFTTNDGEPKYLPLLTDYNYLEGISSISDDLGNLLYYINPNKPLKKTSNVLTNSFEVVSNSEGLLANDDVSNTGLFIQDFSDPNKYFIIYGSALNPNQPHNNSGINYSVLDRTKNNGVGEITIKNKNLYKNSTEKMAGVMNTVDGICWVITHEINNNNFNIIRIDKNGLDESISTQSIGLDHASFLNLVSQGRIGVSPNGTTIAVTVPYYDPNKEEDYRGKVELFDFDPKTGILSNPRTINLNLNTYALAFSPNGKVLYIKTDTQILQLDLTICDVDEMLNQSYKIDTKTATNTQAIERGPNGKIYTVRFNNNYLDAILNPDVIGAGCNYTENVVETGGTNKFGLPTVVNSYFTGEYDDYCALKEEPRIYDIDAPSDACFGDEIEVTIKSQSGRDFTAKIINNLDNIDIINPFDYSEGEGKIIFSLKDKIIWPKYIFKVELTDKEGYVDTVNIQIRAANCCFAFIRNSRFNQWNVSNQCWPVDYQTDLFFSADSNVNCVLEIKKPGELKSTTSANLNLENFEKLPTVGRLLVGDPLPNIAQRAWYQTIATQINTKYRFEATVCNVEKLRRPCTDPSDCDRSLDMWIGVKNRYQQEVLTRVDDIRYEDDWVLISGEFEAKDNFTELQVWVLGNSSNGDISYGFGIDYLDLKFAEELELTMPDDTVVCIGDQYTTNLQFNGEIKSVSWTPTTGLSDPNILNPTITPTTTTNYTVTVTDKFYCEYVGELTIEADSCFEKCVPCVDYNLSSMTTNVGSEYCISGKFTPECPDSTRKTDISLYFEYNPELMYFVSASAKSNLKNLGNQSIVELVYESEKYRLGEANDFSICFLALLSSDSIAQLTIYEDEQTIEKICVSTSDTAEIYYQACALPLRNVIFLTLTSFEAKLIQKEVKIFLSTEETGIFQFVIADINGSVVKDYDFESQTSKYSNEEIFSFDLSDLSAGVYFVRMRTPSGKITSQKIIVE